MFMLPSLFSKPVETGENNPFTRRMKQLVKSFNDNQFHPYKCHILTLRSKELLKRVNKLEPTSKEQLEKLESMNEILVKVCKEMYNKTDPTFIFAFNNEINLVFFYSEYDKHSFVYNGNITKTITRMCSYASLAFYKEISEDVFFNCEYTEFDVDYECLNYIIWRQSECFRNNATMLYKMYYVNADNIGLETICDALCGIPENIDSRILYGNVIKKEIVYKDVGDDLVTRKQFNVSSITLSENFKENLHKFVYNKLM